MATAPFPQITDFSRDVLGRYVCNGLDEARRSTDRNLRPDARPFDVIVVGGGTFGPAFAQHLFAIDKAHRHRILVLEAGPVVLAEHAQNLPMLGLGVADAVHLGDLQNRSPEAQRTWTKDLWGLAWHSPTKFPGLAYGVGGRSLLWGGWSPQLLPAETPNTQWPQPVLDGLRVAPPGGTSYFQQASDQIGVTETNDFISGALQRVLRQMLFAGIGGGAVGTAVSFAELPDHPAAPAGFDRRDLLRLLGLRQQAAQGLSDQDLRDLLKLEAPLAVQSTAPRAGYFPFNKFSAVPLLIKAARAANAESDGDDVKKRLMIVPNCHVTQLATQANGGGATVHEVWTNQGPITLPPGGVVILAAGTIESTRLALQAFGPSPDPGGVTIPHADQIGRNLMAHLRSNLTIRVPRHGLPNPNRLPDELEAAALFVKGRHTYGGTRVGHFHLQITAAGLEKPSGDSEAELFKKVPDIDTFGHFLTANDQHVVITIRGIGEMQPDNPNSFVALDPQQDEFGARRAIVRITPTAEDNALWDAMDQASDEVAKAFVTNLSASDEFSVFTPEGEKRVTKSANLKNVLPYTPNDPQAAAALGVARGRRDGLGTTHHETGPLRMGANPTTSVTNADARFHGVDNAYVVGPALFPTIGSPNPMLTGIALLRRLGDHLAPPPVPYNPGGGFTPLFNGFDTSNWRMSAITNQPGRDYPGKFIVVDGTLESVPGSDLGLFWCTNPLPPDFELILEWLRWREDDNSGVFIRFPHPTSKNYNNTAWVGVDFGFEVQIDQLARDDGAGIHKTAAIYNFAGPQNPNALPVNPPGQWNEFAIRAQGQHYEVDLNGQTVTNFDFVVGSDAAHPDRGLPSTNADPRFTGLQTHTGRVAFRNIRVKAI
jgi:choline dehydrogenase-like flavoprotein